MEGSAVEYHHPAELRAIKPRSIVKLSTLESGRAAEQGIREYRLALKLDIRKQGTLSETSITEPGSPDAGHAGARIPQGSEQSLKEFRGESHPAHIKISTRAEAIEHLLQARLVEMSNAPLTGPGTHSVAAAGRTASSAWAVRPPSLIRHDGSLPDRHPGTALICRAWRACRACKGG
jgi:hypothetical protein